MIFRLIALAVAILAAVAVASLVGCEDVCAESVQQVKPGWNVECYLGGRAELRTVNGVAYQVCTCPPFAAQDGGK